MLPSARIAAVIDLTAEVALTLKENGPSADVLVRQYFLKRRYAGSKDRRYVTNMLYAIIRRWGFLWDCANQNPRLMVITYLHLSGTSLKPLFSGDEHGPAPLNEEELTFLKTVSQEEKPHHKLNYPLWLETELKDRFGNDFENALIALNDRAPLTLRVIRNREIVENTLKEKEVFYKVGEHINSALILDQQIQIRDWPIYRNGQVEIQDEAAQLAVKFVELKPGQQVLDLCAGAGGKTLTAASYMKNKGQIYAFDIVEARLKELKIRAKRSKVHILQTRTLTEKNRAATLSEFKSKMDRVIVDAPCSGTGTWRRNPEARWRITENIIKDYVKTQSDLLEEAWELTKPGGRMIYMTCSILKSENENQIETFLKRHNDASLIPIRKETISSLDGTLLLSPHSHQTDGFYVAILEKKVI